MPTPPTAHLNPATASILADIMEMGEKLADEDLIYCDDVLDETLPKVARQLLHYADYDDSPEDRLIQVFDILTRWVLDPTLIPEGA